MTPPAPYSTFIVVPWYNWVKHTPTDASMWISCTPKLYTHRDDFRKYTYSLTFDAAEGDSFRMRVTADNGTNAYLNHDPSPLLRWETFDPLDYSRYDSWVRVTPSTYDELWSEGRKGQRYNAPRFMMLVGGACERVCPKLEG